MLLGAVGGPAWDDPAAPSRPEDALLGLRSALELFANLRPVRAHESLAHASPLRPEVRRDADILIVRELTGGLYFGRPQGREESNGVDLGGRYAALRTARRSSASWSSHSRWRPVDGAVSQASTRPTCSPAAGCGGRSSTMPPHAIRRSTVEHALVDSTAYRLLTEPRHFDVIVTENLFGDILSDEAAAISGSLGLLASASIGVRARSTARSGCTSRSTEARRRLPVRGSGEPARRRGIGRADAAPLAGEEAAADALEAAIDHGDRVGPANARHRRSGGHRRGHRLPARAHRPAPASERRHERPDPSL